MSSEEKSAEATRLPFSIPGTYQGFAAVAGLATLDGDALVLEFEVKDAVLGLLRSGVEVVRLPVDDLASVSLDQSWLHADLVVRARSMRSVHELPGSRQGQVSLRIARRDRATAEEFTATLLRRIADKRRERLSSGLDS
jgi:hypothetical protein